MPARSRWQCGFSRLLLVVCCLVACQRELADDARPRAEADDTLEVAAAPPQIALPSTAPIAPPSNSEAVRPFNVVLVSIDTLRADHLSAYGYARSTSPNLDALAASGVLFENAYSHSPKTAPSHMSLMTGLHPEVHRVKNQKRPQAEERLADEIPTLALLLQGAGFRTAAFTAGGNVHASLGFDRGFERYEHLDLDASEIFSAGAVEVAAGPEPFFLFLHTYQVHDPYLPPAGFRDAFTDPTYRGGIESDREVLHAAAVLAGHKVVAEFWQRANLQDPADVQHLQDLYDACIRYTDDQLGALLDALENAELAEETLVIVLSDHGEEFKEHGATKHNSLFDEVLRVPLVVRLPASLGVAPARVRPLVRLIDVMPTVLDVVGLPIPEHLAGSSLLPLAAGEEEPARHLFAHWREFDAQALRVGRWKLIRNPKWSHLFDLGSDPSERRALERVAPEVRHQLGTDLDRLVEASSSYGDSISRSGSQPVPMDAAREGRLRALGYLE